MRWEERRRWFRLASHLRCPLQYVQQHTTSTELLEWEKYLEESTNEFHREDTFLMQIALEIRRSWVKDPMKPRLEDFSVKFSNKKSEVPELEEDEDDEEETKPVETDMRTQYIEASKAKWAGIVSIPQPPKANE